MININNIHNGNIKLEFPSISFSQESNTYYWAIDESFEKEDESSSKVLRSLRIMLLKWIDAIVQNKEKRDILYLPFDFADEYMGVLRVSFFNENVLNVEYGYTQMTNGWKISPSQYKYFDIQINDFDSISPCIVMSIDDFIESLNICIENIDSFGNVPDSR
ncbi:hypothetical protein CLV62_15015 [Dysgonomonas alginatilytica]|uniref:Uncharacterized protein n=1 Tax=Dysgonomonas alginatilytica TaxID=1605892 RepID=A0A2V3PIC6_9BACT|nr:hypothetical protein [Dysgonomonas alginatilytica]PXV58390.1 hypothetical protein CLV62_15015 [Dysgonomonas alginatilytica]